MSQASQRSTWNSEEGANNFASERKARPSADPETIRNFTSYKLKWLTLVPSCPDIKPGDAEFCIIIANKLDPVKRVAKIGDDVLAILLNRQRTTLNKIRRRLKALGIIYYDRPRNGDRNIYMLDMTFAQEVERRIKVGLESLKTEKDEEIRRFKEEFDHVRTS